MKTLLLWDIDGTLLRNKGAGKRAMNCAFAMMTGGVEGAFDSLEMAGSLDLHSIHAVFEQHGVDWARLDEFLELYYPCLEEVVADGNSILMPNVRRVLDRAAADDRLYLALGTGNLERGARIKLEYFDLNDYFPVGGFCYGLVERYEVLQDGVERARMHYGVDFAPERVIVIGDTVRDIEAARKIGAKVVAVATGGHSYEMLEAAKPDLLLRDLTEEERFFAFCE
jgi:phosphoglycolate phosphatase